MLPSANDAYKNALPKYYFYKKFSNSGLEDLEIKEIDNVNKTHLEGLINDILDFAKLENGQMKLERADFDLRETLERMADIYRQLATAKGLRFVVPKYANLPRLVCGDGLRIRQVLHNILTNALNFTEKGKITLAPNRRWNISTPISNPAPGSASTLP